MDSILIVEDNAQTKLWLKDLCHAAFPSANVLLSGSKHGGVEAGCAGGIELALIDLHLPDGSGLDVIRAINAASPRTICIVTTIFGDDHHIVQALTAGAHGYLLKEQDELLLVHQLKQLALGIPAISPAVARRLMNHFQFTGPCSNEGTELTPREREVLGLISRGLRVADAACALSVAESTIATHVKSIYRKLGISSRSEATVHATHLGLLSPDKPLVDNL